MSSHLWLWDIGSTVFLHSLLLAECHWHSRKNWNNITQLFCNVPLGPRVAPVQCKLLGACSSFSSPWLCLRTAGISLIPYAWHKHDELGPFVGVVWLCIYPLLPLLSKQLHFYFPFLCTLIPNKKDKFSVTPTAGGCICTVWRPK